MSLDTWLTPRSSQIPVSPTKRRKTGAGAGLTNETKNSRLNSSFDTAFSSLNVSSKCSLFDENENQMILGTNVPEVPTGQKRLPRYHKLEKRRIRAYGAMCLYDALPETFLTTMARKWAPRDISRFDSSPLLVEPLLASSLAVIATSHENTLYTWDSTQSKDPGVRSSQVKKVASVPFDQAITNVTAINPNLLLCTSRAELCLLDVNEQTVIGVPFFPREGVVNIGSAEAHVDGRLIALSTAGGGINVWDLRERSWARCWTRAHANSGPIFNRLNPEINSLLWSTDNVLATASLRNETVKFWDLRARSNSPLMTTNERTSPPINDTIGSTMTVHPAPLKGVLGMVALDGDVWAINESGELLKLSPYQSMPECKIKARAPLMPAAKQPLTVIDDGLNQILGCAGDHGLVTIVPPSKQANDRGIDATYAFCTPYPSCAKGVNSVAFNPVNQHVLGICAESKGAFVWTASESVVGSPVRVRQCPFYY